MALILRAQPLVLNHELKGDPWLTCRHKSNDQYSLDVITNPQMLTRLAARVGTRTFHRCAMSTFTLDKNVFNPTLYKQVTDVWLSGVDIQGHEMNEDVMRRWFMGTPEERLTFDSVCRDYFAHALEAIGPEKLPNPTAEPFLRQVRDIARQDEDGNGSQAAWTTLSMALLLDQMPRNIFRTNAGLVNVYTHYDKIAYALVRTLLSSASPIPRPDLHPQWCNSAAHRMWFYLPLTHSEDIEAHNMLDKIVAQFSKDTEKLEGHAATKKFLQANMNSEREHREVLNRFGRYPHRNTALGRKSTEEEERFLKEGGATFGVTQ
jgi:uncharacterized protein (DUF924 family)